MSADLTLFGTISLGGLIKLLEHRDPTQDVQFNFCGFVPTGLESYRGFYDHLALGHTSGQGAHYSAGTISRPTVESLLGTLRAANGKTFEGYKGGSYRMGLETPLWVENVGECHGTSILGLDDCDYIAVIMTGYAR